MRIRKIVSAIIVLIMVLQSPICCFAEADRNNMISDQFSIQSISNWTSFSEDDQQLITKSINNPNDYLTLSEVYKDMVVLIYNTDNDNIKIAITDGYVEIVKRLGEKDFSINGVLAQVWIVPNCSHEGVLARGIKKGNTRDPYGWIETSYLDKPWVYNTSNYEDVYSQDPFVTYSVGVLSAIFALILELSPLAGFAYSVAVMLITAALPWANTGRVLYDEYLDTVSSNPILWYRKLECTIKAYHGGVYTTVGYETRYYFLNLV